MLLEQLSFCRPCRVRSKIAPADRIRFAIHPISHKFAVADDSISHSDHDEFGNIFTRNTCYSVVLVGGLFVQWNGSWRVDGSIHGEHWG
jgi:hypothetical protein